MKIYYKGPLFRDKEKWLDFYAQFIVPKFIPGVKGWL